MAPRLIPIYCPTAPQWYELPDVEEIPDQIWFWGGDKPPKDLTLGDLYRATEMHEGHDYRITATHFRFCYSHGSDSWIIFQYGGGDPETIDCPDCGEGTNLPFDARFCGMCGKALR